MIAGLIKNILRKMFVILRKRVITNKSIFFWFLRSLYREYIENLLTKFFPLLDSSVMLALTYKCTCSCTHCGVALYKSDNKNELDSDEILKLIDETKKMGVTKIYFFGGEPLLVPKLFDYIKYAKQNGFLTVLDTNGFLLNEKMVINLKNAGLDVIGVSIDTCYEDIHDQLRGITGLFKKAIEGLKYCKKHELECYMSTYATKNKLKNGELKKTIDLAKSLNLKVRILSPIMVGRWLKRDEIVLNNEEIEQLRNLLEKNKVYWENEHTDCKENSFFCNAARKKSIYISPYGDIQPCCYCPITYGNIREKSLEYTIKKMWKSDIFDEYKGNDCLVNDENFRKQYSKWLDKDNEFPKKYESNLE